EKFSKHADRFPIFLASALDRRKDSSNIPRGGREDSSKIATPQQLLGGVNRWKRVHHQHQIGLDALTIRVADEIFNLRENQSNLWEIDNELLLESLKKNVPFIYPVSIDVEEPATPGEPTGFKMLSISKRLPLPLRGTLSVEISSLPDDLKT